jgi:hypothetical protein
MSLESEPRKVGVGLGIGILLVPYFAAWFLLQKGYSNTARAVGFGWMLLIIILASGKSFAPPNNNVVASKTNNSSDASAEPEHHPTVTASEFNLMTPGVTTYSLISQYLGPGELQSSSNIGGVTTESYVWSNPDGSNMSLMFQNDRLVMKAQYGLQ